MSMNVRLTVLSVVGVLAVAVFGADVAAADTITYDFEAETATAFPSTEALTSLSITVSGVTMTITRSSGEGFDVWSTASDPWPASWDSKHLGAFESPYPTDVYVIEFSQDVYGLTLEFGDFGSDSDTPVSAKLFSGTGGGGLEVDSASGVWAASDTFPSFGTLMLTGQFRSATFTSGGSFPNTLFWDNFTINTVNPVPEPATIALIGIALGGGAIARRRRARAARS
jgi:hypothetical protein